ncbi:MAG TPA: pseudouridine-5'-phosphate glycosidase [Isosphaeraceae bacterium]|jgi:pseudouridine-5'-phosphate glycosidase|nr:pseudouridine-5'-phosphate glycosidase [Isosphaeraceae bacterium]
MGATSHRIAAEVQGALMKGGPCVALESTLVAQGLPHPENLETARAVEAAVRAAGATPATIAVVAGRVVVGLDDVELQRLARPGDIRKAGRRDLAAAVAHGLDAATTVAATLWVARSSGLGVLATGGLGGVHRDAATTGDVSNDLDELARADGALVVCSGVKSILDVPATLEALEARGVLIVGYRTGELAGFTTASSGLGLEHRVDSPAEAAELVRAHRSLGLPGAIVLAQPVDPALALDRAEHDLALAAALAEARARGVSGKPLTPFLLDRLRAATAGRSLAANRALIVANARLAAEVAVFLS